MPGEKVKGINLKVRRGEILGIGGLAGGGKIGIANGIAGIFPTKGSVIINGEKLKSNSVKQSLKSGIAFLSEDRRETGLFLDESIENNIILTSAIVNKKFLRKGLLAPLQIIDRKAVKKHYEKMKELLDLRCVDCEQSVRRLSGGNQQKVCISRAITLEPKILMVSEPTRGVDVGAKRLILKKIDELNKEGMTIIFTSSELLELRAIADRILIITDGKIVADLPPDAEDKDFGLAMAGDLEDLKAEYIVN